MMDTIGYELVTGSGSSSSVARPNRLAGWPKDIVTRVVPRPPRHGVRLAPAGNHRPETRSSRAHPRQFRTESPDDPSPTSVKQLDHLARISR